MYSSSTSSFIERLLLLAQRQSSEVQVTRKVWFAHLTVQRIHNAYSLK
jgi:hypothetical protein